MLEAALLHHNKNSK